MKLVSLTLLVGCSTSPVDPPAPAPLAPTTTPSGLAENPLSHRSVWRGHYMCRQGETALQLSLDAAQGTTVGAIFEFGAWPSNPGVPSGSYALTGHLEESAQGVSLRLAPSAGSSVRSTTRW